MPQIVTCPDCGRKLKVPDDLVGKRVKCPGCGQKFVGEVEGGGEEAEETAPPRTSVATSRSDDAPRSRRRDEDEIEDRPKSRRRDEEEDEDYPVKRRRRDEDGGGMEPTKGEIRTGWERVRFGLNLIIIAVWIGVGTVVVAVLGWLCLVLFGAASFGSTMSSLFSATGASNQQEQVHEVGGAVGNMAGTGAALIAGGCLVGGLMILLSLAATGCSMTGEGFCMGIASTKKTQALKVLAIVVFCLACANLLIPMASFGGGALLARDGGGCLIFAGDLLWGLLWLAEIICFLLFLRGVAVVMKRDTLAQNVVFYMIGLGVYALFIPVAWVVMIFAFFGSMFSAISSVNANNPGAAAGNVAGTGAAMFVGGLACFGVVLLVGLALFVWYIVLLYQVRSAVDGWLDRN